MSQSTAAVQEVLPELSVFIFELLRAQKFSEAEARSVLPSTNLIELGFVDSFTMLEVVVFLESRFKIQFSPAHFMDDHFTSMEKMSRLTRELIGEQHVSGVANE